MPPKVNKKDINTSVTAMGSFHTWRYNGKAITVDFGVSPNLANREVRKLLRDPSSPKTKNEKPYLNLKILVEYPRGGVCYAHQATGAVHTVMVGDLGSTTYSASPKAFNTLMGFPNQNARYTPQAGEWPINPDLLSQAETRCYLALRKKYGEMDLDSNLSFGIWFGERREMASLVRGVGNAMLGLFQAYRSKDPSQLVQSIKAFKIAASERRLTSWARRELQALKKAKGRGAGGTALKTVDSVNQAILTWNLGVSPLLRDADAAYKALRYDTVKDPTALLIKAKGWIQKQEVNSETVKTDRGHVTVTTRVNHVSRYTSVMIARPSITDLALLERLGLGNPLSLAAELTTCSFIVNYYWGILDYLKASSVPMAFEFVDGSWSKKISHLCWVDIRSSSSSGNRKASGRWIHVEYNRKVYGKFPFPTPPLSFKGQDTTFSQDLNTATVIWSRVRKAMG